jgi:hypothetical protein
MNAAERLQQDEGPCILVVTGRKFSEGVKNSNVRKYIQRAYGM